MSKLNELYKSKSDDSMVEVIHAGNGELQCDGYPMRLLKEKSTAKLIETHQPIIEKSGYGIIVKVGKTPHPMEKNHYIEFIAVQKGSYVSRSYCKPYGKAEAIFCHDFKDDLIVSIYCTIHGLWKNHININLKSEKQNIVI